MMNAKLIVGDKEFDIEILDPELQELISQPEKNTWYGKIHKMTLEELAEFLDGYRHVCNPMHCDPDDCPYSRGHACTSTMRFLKSVPQEDVCVQKYGRWLINSDGYYPYCSECGKEPQGRALTDFCPNCGTDMRGDKNG